MGEHVSAALHCNVQIKLPSKGCRRSISTRICVLSGSYTCVCKVKVLVLSDTY